MNYNKDDFYELVSDLITRDEFEERISKFKKLYSNLISEAVLAHLVVDELGRNVQTTNNEIECLDINSISEDGPVNISGTISWKSQIRTFTRKDKGTGKVLNIDIYDGTGTIRLTLWDNNADLAEKFNIGD